MTWNEICGDYRDIGSRSGLRRYFVQRSCYLLQRLGARVSYSLVTAGVLFY